MLLQHSNREGHSPGLLPSHPTSMSESHNEKCQDSLQEAVSAIVYKNVDK